MAKITINRDRCKGCLVCIGFCPKGLIRVSKDLNRRGVKPAEFQESPECVACGLCALICPECCIEVYK